MSDCFPKGNADASRHMLGRVFDLKGTEILLIHNSMHEELPRHLEIIIKFIFTGE